MKMGGEYPGILPLSGHLNQLNAKSGQHEMRYVLENSPENIFNAEIVCVNKDKSYNLIVHYVNSFTTTKSNLPSLYAAKLYFHENIENGKFIDDENVWVEEF